MSGNHAVHRQDDYPGPANRTWAICLISVLGLYLEMLLIRWIGTEVRIFAYLQNTILVVCFLGLGIGCFTCRRPIIMRNLLLPLVILVLLMAIPLTRRVLGSISTLLSVLDDLVIWSAWISRSPWDTVSATLLGLAMTFVLMVLVLEMFVPVGRLLGRLMDDHPRTIWAYSVNIAGSLLGTWLFVLLSVLYQPPFTWFLILAVLMLFFLNKGSRNRRLNLMLTIALVPLSWFAGLSPGAVEVIWSPYQKLELWDKQRPQPKQYPLSRHLSRLFYPGTFPDEPIYFQTRFKELMVTVNNTGYQQLMDLSAHSIPVNPRHPPPDMKGYGQYDLPLLLHPHPQSFLIVGAGTGNDAAGGVRHNVKHITAVEIDPAIIALGKAFHPERPYAAPTVRLVNDDARSYFATAQEKFDVISFGLLDSHTTTAMTNARLDHYVYTKESIARAKSLLSDGGVMVLSFEAEKNFIADRMAEVLRQVFGAAPIVFRIPHGWFGWGGVIFIAGDLSTARGQIAKDPVLAELIAHWQQMYPISLTYRTRITTDDWPYVYLEKPRIPLLYFLLGGLMILLLLFCHRYLHLGEMVRGWTCSYWHFFFLGAAFLLLEVQNISKASVVLGNTWEVNAVIISGVLAMILLANLLAFKFPEMPLAAVYTLLCGTCLALYFVDLSRFAFLPYVTKAIIVGALTTLPMLFSGIVFIRSFAAVAGKDKALGANLIGALMGALLQSVTFLTGIKALLLIVAALYFLALLTRPRAASSPQPVPVVSAA